MTNFLGLTHQMSDAAIERTLDRLASPYLVGLTATTTVCRDAARRLALRSGIAAGGLAQVDGLLVSARTGGEPRGGVSVSVEGETVGFLPSFVSSDAVLAAADSLEVPLQVAADPQPKGLRVEVWAWLGEGTPRWPWSSEVPPPMTTPAKEVWANHSTRRSTRRRLGRGGAEAAATAAGMSKGVHYLELVEPIKALKREGRLEEALVLCYAAIEGAEGALAADGLALPPWYTEQAAIVLRKLGRRDEEVAVLERYLRLMPHGGSSWIEDRLRKLIG